MSSDIVWLKREINELIKDNERLHLQLEEAVKKNEQWNVCAGKLREQLLAAPVLLWKNEFPTVPGDYWMGWSNMEGWQSSLVHVWYGANGNKIELFLSEEGERVLLGDLGPGFWFAGPLQQPPPPPGLDVRP